MPMRLSRRTGVLLPGSKAGQVRELLSKRGPMSAQDISQALGGERKSVSAILSDMDRRQMIRRDDSAKPIKWSVR
jgi:DNA-binding IclR family transcriptional regulator